MGHFSGIGFFGVIIYSIIPLILMYLIIRLAVRHAIESSDIAVMLRQKMRNEQQQISNLEDNNKASK